MIEQLTPRELQVMAHLADAGGDREAVADRLHIGLETVRSHVQAAIAKAGGGTALVVFRELGWLRVPRELLA